ARAEVRRSSVSRRDPRRGLAAARPAPRGRAEQARGPMRSSGVLALMLSCTLLGACGFHRGSAFVPPDIDAAVVDTAVVVDSIPPDAYFACFGSGLVRVCLTTPPPSTLTPLGATLDTSTSTACLSAMQSDGSTVCVIAAQALSIDSPLAV